MRVYVKRPDGRDYRTEFMACTECRVMLHSPEDVTLLRETAGHRLSANSATQQPARTPGHCGSAPLSSINGLHPRGLGKAATFC
jgi:hypothetical protein